MSGIVQQPYGAMGSTGYLIYDVSTPGAIGPAVVNSYTTLSIPAYWRAQDFLASNMASFPRAVRRNNVDVPHRLTKLLTRKPNDYQNSTQFWRTLFFHRHHYNNGFAEIERDSLFNPAAFHNRLPEQVAPFRYIADDGSLSQWYWVGGFKPHVVPAADMIHLHGLGYDGIGGINPVFLLAETFERARLLSRYVTRFLTKGSMIRGSIEIPAGASEEQQKTIVNTISTHFRGADAERDVLVLSDGAKLNNNTLSPQESQLIEQANYSTKEIAQITGVHPHFLFDDSEGKYNNNPTQAAEDVVKWTFRPLIEQAEDELSLKLLSDAEQDAGLSVHIDPTSILRGDRQTQSTILTQQKNAGIITGNEARAEIGLPPSKDPEADKLKSLGDTAPPKPLGAAPAVPQADKPQQQSAIRPADLFADIIADAARRITNKTVKATDTNRKKFAADADAWLRWGNVFSGEQKTFVAEVIGPVVKSFEAVAGRPASATPEVLGERYAQALRRYFAELGRGIDAEAPDASALIGEIFTNG